MSIAPPRTTTPRTLVVVAVGVDGRAQPDRPVTAEPKAKPDEGGGWLAATGTRNGLAAPPGGRVFPFFFGDQRYGRNIQGESTTGAGQC